MRQIGTIPPEQDAQRFGDYLVTLGIDNTVEESKDGWAVWVANDDQLDRGRAELESFLVNPGDVRYDAAKKVAADLRTEQQKLADRRRARFVDVRTRLGQPRQWNAPLTLGLIGISLIVAVLTRLETKEINDAQNALFIAPVTVVGDYIQWEDLEAIKHGQVWRLVTPIFLHFGILHLVFNMFWLRDLGSMIETRRSTWFLAILVLVAAVVPNLAQYFMTHNPKFGGMSGVVYALFGYVWVTGRVDPSSGIGIGRDSAILMMVWLVLAMTGILGPIANAAHVVGLIVGVAFAYAEHWVRRLRRSR